MLTICHFPSISVVLSAENNLKPTIPQNSKYSPVTGNLRFLSKIVLDFVVRAEIFHDLGKNAKTSCISWQKLPDYQRSTVSSRKFKFLKDVSSSRKV